MKLKQIIKTILTEVDTSYLTLETLKHEIESFLDENNISEEKIIVRESKNELFYLNDYNSLDMAIWECIQQNLGS